MTAAKRRGFNAVIVESLDRLSRDQEDMAGLFKRLNHFEIELLTVNEGLATDVHVGVRGIVSSLYLKDLAAKIKRGQNGLVSEGLFPGAVTYGYSMVPGKPAERVINEEQAKIVRRIFTEYANGSSPRKIAAKMTSERIPAPSGGTEWNYQSLVSGGGKKHGGILGNKIYIGELIWNQAKTVKNPDTGSESKRARPKAEHISVAVPHMRIIDQKLWDKAQAVRMSRSETKLAGKVIHRPVLARTPHLLAGLLRCGACNGHMINSKTSNGQTYIMCSAAMQRASCSHRKHYMLAKVQRVVLDGMRDRLTSPERIKKAARTFHAEYAEQEKKNRGERLAVEKQRNKIVVQIDRLVTAISDTDEPLPALLASLKTKEIERAGIEERLRLLGASSNVVSMHPNVIEDYQKNIEKLHEELSRDPGAAENRVAFRNMIDSVIVHPVGHREPYDISVYGRLSAIMGRADLFPTARSNKEILAAEGFPRGDMDNPG
jgi:site-specific DNA recombinase